MEAEALSCQPLPEPLVMGQPLPGHFSHHACCPPCASGAAFVRLARSLRLPTKQG